MSEQFFAEATVRIKPDLTGFIGKLRTGVLNAIASVEKTRPPKVKIGPALTVNFIGDLRTQVIDAVTRAQKGIKLVQIRAVLADTSRTQIAREIRTATRTVGAGRTVVPGPAASIAGALSAETAALVVGLGGASAELKDLIGVQRVFAPTQERFAALAALGGRNLDFLAEASERASGAQDVFQRQVQESATAMKVATGTAAALESQFRAIQQHGSLDPRQKLSEFKRLTTRGVLDIGLIEGKIREQGGVATPAQRAELAAYGTTIANLTTEVNALESATSRARIGTTKAAEAVRRAEAQAAKAARTQAQLRRGVLATSLSFLGIRGATLAASASFLIGAAAIATFARALQAATAFTDQLNIFRATTSATAQDMVRVSDAARALGADLSLPGVTAGDAAEAMTELAKAGLSVQESIDGARGVLQLATAAAIDNAQSVELVANAINSFQLAGEDATRVADTFANAANSAQGSIVDIGTAFQQAAAAGRQVGLSFEDTSLFLTELAKNGLRGSDSGTSLRTALLRLIKPSDEAKEKLKELGVTLRDAEGNLRPDIFIQLAEATKNLSPAARDATIAMIGGQDAFRAISILGRQSIDDFVALRQELRKQGTAGDLAAARMQGLRGAVEGLGNTLSTAGTRIGQGMTPVLQRAVVDLTHLAEAMAGSETLGNTLAGTMDFVNTVFSAFESTAKTLEPLVAGLTNAMGKLADSIGVPTILAGLAAWKLYPATLGKVITAVRGLQAAMAFQVFVEAASMRQRALESAKDPLAARGFKNLAAAGVVVPDLEPLETGATVANSRMATLAKTTTSFVRGLPLLQIGAVAAAAGLYYLLTRESEAEKRTRELAEATRDLVSAQKELADAEESSFQAGKSVNARELAVLEARQAQARAARVAASAPEGTFEAKKADLEYRVATDNVAIAIEALNKAIEDSISAKDIAAQASREAKEAAQKEIDKVRELSDAYRKQAEVLGQGGQRRGATSQDQAENQAKKQKEAVDQFIADIDRQEQALRKESTAESIALAKRLDMLKQVAKATGEVPGEVAIEVAIDPNRNTMQALRDLTQMFGITGKQALNQFMLSVGVMPKDLQKLVDEIAKDYAPRMSDAGSRGADAFMDATKDKIEEKTPDVLAAIRKLAEQAAGQLAGLERQQTVLEIAGASDAVLLANLDDQVAAARKQVRQRRKALAAAQEKGKGIHTAREDLTAARNELNTKIKERKSFAEQMASDAERAADDAKQEQEKRDQNLLDLLGFRRDRKQERILDAQMTEGLRDDILANQRLQRLVLQQIERIKKDVQTGALKKSALRELSAMVREITREIQRLQRERRDQILQEAVDRAQLNIEYAQITENKSAEVRAHKAKIKALKAQQKRLIEERGQRAKNSVEYLQLRNAIAAEQKAIKDLRQAERDLFHEMSFEFLTRQQGFAATVMSNLLGPVTLTGAVGGVTQPTKGAPATSPLGGIRGAEGFGGGLAEALILASQGKSGGGSPSSQLSMRAAESAAGARGGTPSQFTTIIHLLGRMVTLLSHQNERAKHPNNRHSKAVNNATMDHNW